MKFFLTTLIFSISVGCLYAQQDRFIYLEAENHQPFFVKLNNQVFNSLAAGYLIIPKLDDGNYNLLISFLGNGTEQSFTCALDQKDAGFLIRSSEPQWQLMNLQTKSVINAAEMAVKTEPQYEYNTDPFSVMLAYAVHDSTILRKEVTKEIVTAPVTNDSTADSTALATNVVTKPAVTDSAALADKANKTLLADSTAMVAIPDNSRKDSLASDIRIEPVNDRVVPKDTVLANAVVVPAVTDSGAVRVVTVKEGPPETKMDSTAAVVSVPVVKDSTQGNDMAVTKPEKKKRTKKNDNALQDTTQVVKTEPLSEVKDTAQTVKTELPLLRSVIRRRSKKNTKEGLEMVYVVSDGDYRDTVRLTIPVEKIVKEEVTASTDTVVVVPKKKTDPITKEEKEIIKEANRPQAVMINSDCKESATDDDFLRTRKRMVAQMTDADMVKVAKKIFRAKCFTTEQVKNLSVLFLLDDAKYIFFEAAYPFVSDSDQFYTLEKQFSSADYMKRFRTLIHK